MGQVSSISRAIIAVLLCLLTTPVFAWSHGLAVNTCPQGASLTDGCLAAPSGTPQFASYLNTGTAINAGLAGVGSGYTNGTGYAWSLTCSTTNATGTVDVVGGALSNVQITSHGSNCTGGSNNITTPVGAGAGSGGQIQAYVPKVRPPRNVAGIDYAVGPAVTPTLDPATISIAGVSVNTTTCLISITGSNITLSGYDFTKLTCNSGAGGWFISISGSNVTITNFIAKNPQTSVTVQGFITITGGSGQVINYGTIDGNIANQTGASDGYSLKSTGAGAWTVEYVYSKGAYGNNIVTGQFAALTLKYNILTNSKYNVGTHGEYVNAATGTASSLYDFNLTIQDYADSTGFPGELSSVWENSAQDSSYSISGLSQSSNTSFLFGTAGHTASGLPDNHAAASVWSDLHTIPAGSSVNTSPSVQGNYVAASGLVIPASGFLTCDASVVTPVVSGNVNMDTNLTIVGVAPCN